MYFIMWKYVVTVNVFCVLSVQLKHYLLTHYCVLLCSWWFNCNNTTARQRSNNFSSSSETSLVAHASGTIRSVVIYVIGGICFTDNETQIRWDISFYNIYRRPRFIFKKKWANSSLQAKNYSSLQVTLSLPIFAGSLDALITWTASGTRATFGFYMRRVLRQITCY